MKHGCVMAMTALAVWVAGGLGAWARPAPAFTATDSNGKAHSLGDYKGKVVVLEWINPDCPFVKKHYGRGNMQGLQKTYAGKGVVWLSVASSAAGKQGHYDAATWNAKLKELGAAPTALLLDAEGTVGKAYGAKTTPHMFVVNAAGEIVYEGAIDDKSSTNADDIPGARSYIKDALEAVLAGKPVEPAATAPYGCSVKYGN